MKQGGGGLPPIFLAIMLVMPVSSRELLSASLVPALLPLPAATAEPGARGGHGGARGGHAGDGADRCQAHGRHGRVITANF